MNIRTLSFAALTAALALSACSPKAEQSADNASQAAGGKGGEVKLLNVSYDVARDFYKEYNPLFVKEFAAKTADNRLKSNSRTAAPASRLWLSPMVWLPMW